MDKEQSVQGLKFIKLLKTIGAQVNQHDEGEVEEKVQEKTGAEQPDKEEPRDTQDVVKEGKQKGSRAHITSICYDVLNRSILSPLSKPESDNIKKQIQKQGDCSHRSFTFYFLLLLKIYPEERRNAEEYSEFRNQVEEGIDVHFMKNQHGGEFIEKTRKEIMRIVEATEHFFIGGDIEKTVHLCYDGRKRKSNNVGSLKTAKNKSLEVIKKSKQQQ